MQPEVQKNTIKQGRKTILLVSLLVFIFIMLAASTQFLYMLLKNDKVYKGVYINSFNAGKLNKAELSEKLRKKFQVPVDSMDITVTTGNISEKISFKKLKVSYDIDRAVNDAYSIGRNGNIFNRLSEIVGAGFDSRHINMSLTYDAKILESFIESIYTATYSKVSQPEILIGETEAFIRSGRHGEHIDKDALKKSLHEILSEAKSATISVDIIKDNPEVIDIEELYSRLNVEPKNADYVDDNGKLTLKPHVFGMSIDKEALTDIINILVKNEGEKRQLPLVLKEPDITTEKASAMLFKDQLAKMTTSYSTSNENDRNRGENIKIAVSKINNYILAPGAEFSFNTVVGKRSEEDGYLKAHTYVGGKVIDGIGGGICQVSTTLYGAVLRADLEVVERRNHMFTVGYVPYGQDATVSYGTTDFRFKNNTGWPLKMEAGVIKGNKVYFTFSGTQQVADKKVVITQQIVKKTPYSTRYVNDPTMAEGKTFVKQDGKEGYVVNTFKTVKIAGKVVSETKLHTSTYRSLEKIVLKGTKKVAAPNNGASPEPQKTPVPEVTPTPGVDDADNPPAE